MMTASLDRNYNIPEKRRLIQLAVNHVTQTIKSARVKHHSRTSLLTLSFLLFGGLAVLVGLRIFASPGLRERNRPAVITPVTLASLNLNGDPLSNFPCKWIPRRASPASGHAGYCGEPQFKRGASE
jgi:hypothetical protein